MVHPVLACFENLPGKDWYNIQKILRLQADKNSHEIQTGTGNTIPESHIE